MQSCHANAQILSGTTFHVERWPTPDTIAVGQRHDGVREGRWQLFNEAGEPTAAIVFHRGEALRGRPQHRPRANGSAAAGRLSHRALRRAWRARRARAA